jgi:hypothetical protein
MPGRSISQEDREKLKHEFESATVKHILFKSKVKSYLYGSDIDTEPITNYLECNFGKWIYEKGLPLFGDLPEMQELEKVHKEIHEFASYLVKLKNENQAEKALSQLPRLEILATNIYDLLKKVEVKAGLV